MGLENVLKEFEFGQKQEVGVMAVIPLIEKETTESPVAPLKDLKFKGTSTYGTMLFENENSEKPVIIPAGYMALTKQLAQDHALPVSHILEAKEGIQYVDFACCVEQTQGGYIQVEKDFEFQLLPINVRKQHAASLNRLATSKHFHLENYSDFSRLWAPISQFQNKMIKDGKAHIVWFFNKFVSQLDEFNAEFEAVEGQRGAIILINNKIVGIEVAPSQEDWKVLWQRLIRETYGSEVIRLSYEDLVGTFEKKEKVSLNLDGANSIEDIENAIVENEKKTFDSVNEEIQSLLKNITPIGSNKSTLANLKFNGVQYLPAKIGDDKLVEVYTKDDKVVYASIIL